MNPFYNQPDFLTRDPSFNFKTESGIVLNNQENLYTRLTHCIPLKDIKGRSVLDIGSKTSAAAGYVLFNGASKYVGVEKDYDLSKIANENIKKYYPGADASILCSSAEEFIKNTNKKFDIVLLGRVLHLINDGAYFLKKLSTIANTIIIEDVHPLCMPVVYLKDHLENQSDFIPLFYNLEYSYALSETYSLDLFEQIKNYPCVDDNTDRLSSTVYSIGFLKGLLSPVGFNCDLSSYENLKKIFPEEYGYGLYKNRDGVKKFVARFNKNV
jgi:hypothetical protein